MNYLAAMSSSLTDSVSGLQACVSVPFKSMFERSFGAQFMMSDDLRLLCVLH